MIDVSRYAPKFKTPPFHHQLVGVERLVNQEFFGLLDEMGAGKSKQVIDAACVLHAEGQIDTVVVVAPASVRSVWLDPELGEIAKHCWRLHATFEFHAKGFVMRRDAVTGDYSPLCFIVTNYEFIRREAHRKRLLELLKNATFMMVCDESAFIKNHRAAQTKAALDLGQHAARRVILNGTPIVNNPGDMWPQLQFLSPKILPFRNFFAFRAQYAVMGGYQGRQVVRWQNLDDLQARVQPYVIRREKKDCLDLPPKLYTTLEVPLSEKTWRVYKEMREEAVAFIDDNPSLAAQAGVKAMRLAQICAGYLGGFEDGEQARHVGDEKLHALQGWLEARLAEDRGAKIICWCRFRRQLERVAAECYPLLTTFKLYGGQSAADRAQAIHWFSNGRNNGGAALLCAQPQAGGFGLNLTAASQVVYLSNDFSLASRLQSEDRAHRPGQTRNVTYLDVVATGPAGQKTIEAHVLKALRTKGDLANWTASAWRDALVSE